MIKFLRISSIYPGFLKKINKKFKNNDTYEKNLNLVFDERYSVSNNISEELKKKNYECTEVIYNYKNLQNKWLNQYGNKKLRDEVIFQQIKFYNPDVLFIGDFNLLDKKFVSKVKSISKTKLILCFHCAPISEKIYNQLKYADAIVTCTKGYKNKISNKLMKNTLLIQHAFKVKENLDFIRKREIDVSFLGSLFLDNKLHLGRVEIIYNLIKNFKNSYVAINFARYFLFDFILLILNSIIKFSFIKNIKTFYKIIYIFLFSKKPLFGKDMLNILKNSKILINKHIEDTKYAGNMRLFEATGSGSMLLTDYKTDLENLFDIEKEIIVFNNNDQLFEQIDYYLVNDEKRLEIAKNGYKKTLSFHNYQNRVNKLDKFIRYKLYNENL
tara:strand:- start:1022 stop:2173 length:1152 start_codon:yes stop_codon:yes gene_type:complete